MEPVILARLSFTMVRIVCCSASAANCLELVVGGVSCLVRQHLFLLEENFEDMGAYLWVGECALDRTQVKTMNLCLSLVRSSDLALH